MQEMYSVRMMMIMNAIIVHSSFSLSYLLCLLVSCLSLVFLNYKNYSVIAFFAFALLTRFQVSKFHIKDYFS